jgi:ABC-type amino acid transport system permease subunit
MSLILIWYVWAMYMKENCSNSLSLFVLLFLILTGYTVWACSKGEGCFTFGQVLLASIILAIMISLGTVDWGKI